MTSPLPSPLRQVRIADDDLQSYDIRKRKVVFANSKAYKKIFAELFEYTIERSKGGSVLISGHRGSGKTTLITNAIDSVAATLTERHIDCKPLLIPLHGPDLLDPERTQKTSDKTTTSERQDH